MLVLKLLLIWFALSPVVALAFGAFVRGGRGPVPSAPPGLHIAVERSAPPQPGSLTRGWPHQEPARTAEPDDRQHSPPAAA
jgi:hypothetical protein